jgi:ribosomal protein L11 methyltransferase
LGNNWLIMQQGKLYKVSVAISAAAEDLVSELCERLFRQSPSIYTDAKTLRTRASVFLKPRSEWSSERRAELRAGLAGIREAGVDLGSGRVTVEVLGRQDWAESWKKHFPPLVIGQALLIQPSWSRRRPATGQARVILDPGLSFGTGQHPTTRFCLEEMVGLRRQRPTPSFLDVGTGSGILAIAAAKLGYDPVSALDFDPDAVRIARGNAARNGVRTAIRFWRQDIGQLPARSRVTYDLVCANLTSDLLVAHRERLIGRVRTGGRLVLAGILESQFRAVQAAFTERGGRLTGARTVGEWRSGVFEWP